MDDLIAFIGARLDDDERDPGGWSRERVLREVEAKRAILAIHHPYDHGVLYERACHGCGWTGDLDDPITDHIDECPMLRVVASVYRNHPDYQTRWGATESAR